MPSASRTRGVITSTFVSFCCAALLSGCVEMVQMQQRSSAATRGEIFAKAKNALPALREGSARVFFFRPQFLVGFYASPIVIVNGRWMGDKGDLNKNLFLPGCVFVVDSDAPELAAWLFQAGREETDKKLSLAGRGSRVHYVRYASHPTYVALELVNEAVALPALDQLHLSGYVDLRQ